MHALIRDLMSFGLDRHIWILSFVFHYGISTLSSLSFFFTSHISLVMFIPTSFSLLLLTWHYLYFTLSGGFQHIIACRVVTSFPISPYECSSNILVWDIVLLVRIHVTSIHRESLPIWLCIFIEVCFVLIMVCKKNNNNNALFICLLYDSMLSTCMYMGIYFVHVLLRFHMWAPRDPHFT